VADLEFGGMGGVGANGCEQENAWCDESDGIWDMRRITGGGYVGSGIGYRRDWLNLYSRTRLQLSSATGIPATFWYAIQGGVQFTLKSRAHIYLANGGAGYVNATDHVAIMWVPAELGFVITFGGDR
jgi:hypothetical protein